MLSVRNATATDIPLIKELTMQVWPQTYVPIIGEDQVQYMLNQFYTEQALEHQMEVLNHRFVICDYNEQPAAFASVSLIEPGIWKLQKLYIVATQQGKGIGRFVVQHLVNEIGGTGATHLRLNVNIHNTAAIEFYCRIGFKHFKDEDIDIGNGFFMNDHVLQMMIQ